MSIYYLNESIKDMEYSKDIIDEFRRTFEDCGGHELADPRILGLADATSVEGNGNSVVRKRETPPKSA